MNAQKLKYEIYGSVRNTWTDKNTGQPRSACTLVIGQKTDSMDNEKGVYGYQFREVRVDESVQGAVSAIGSYPCEIEAEVKFVPKKDFKTGQVSISEEFVSVISPKATSPKPAKTA